MDITAAVVRERSGPFVLETAALAPPRADEVLVRIVATGLCHTDLHARDGYFPTLPYPAVFGHEGAGVVVETGAHVRDLAPGDPVVISFPWCGECEPCRQDFPAYCRRGPELKMRGARADGSTPLSRGGAPLHACFFQQSSLATHAVAPARDVVRVRRDAPLELLGPFACGIQTGAGAVLNAMAPRPGQSLVVFGVGSVGLAGLMAAKIAGCDPIVAVDIRANRLDLARDLGATHAIDNGREDAVAAIRRITGGGAHLSLETSAVPAVLRQAVDGLAGRGTCVLVGSARAGTEASIDMRTLQQGRVLRGVVQGESRPRDFIPLLVEHFMAGRFPVERLVTVYDFAEINRAAEDAVAGRTIKPVLRMPG